MTARAWNAEIAKEELFRLTAPDLLGFYTHVEATTVFAIPPGQTVTLNVFSILVAEERLFDGTAEPHYLNPKPIRLPSLKDWFFGVRRYLIPVGELGQLFDQLRDSKKWQLSGERLHVGELVPIPPQFVPPDSTGSVPLNRVLKNNFWNGSYVFEWAERKKAQLRHFFDDALILQQLAEAIRPFAPIGIDGLSDRLGNIILQLPVTVLIAKFGHSRTSNDFTVTIAWHPRAASRPLRATCEKQHDHVISEFISAPTGQPDTLLPMRGGRGLHRAMVWDDQNRVLLAASGELAFISSISLQMWDPYLTADDVLNTLFYSRHPSADLRALSAGNAIPNDASSPRKPSSCVERLRECMPRWLQPAPARQPVVTFADRQREILDGTKSNFLGLRLEFRVKAGQAGWPFHDRFLIFPATGRGALAWSLGTSINSLGKQHHILQRVDDGQLIMQAFRELWDQLNQPEHLVWKKP